MVFTHSPHNFFIKSSSSHDLQHSFERTVLRMRSSGTVSLGIFLSFKVLEYLRNSSGDNITQEIQQYLKGFSEVPSRKSTNAE